MGRMAVLTVAEVKEKAVPILRRYGATRAGVFGSCARGEMRDDSDVDVLIEISGRISLLDFVDIKLDLEDILGRKVDLVEYDAIKPLLRERILNEEIRIL